MDKRSWTPVLLILALASIGYAIYRSTAQRIVVTEGNRVTTYGEPQDGLLLGLLILGGLSLLASVFLSTLPDRRRDTVVRTEEGPIANFRR
ncbi:MAG: hypothetical protein EOO11_00450 [Chitinophagaceae bacterium]|nr:MAG: hypothetical protein EOO11_00450 [Chitinophagaceae bacterium]